MIYLISWSGRGGVVFLGLLACIVLMIAVGLWAFIPALCVLGLSLLVLALLCWVYGRRWNSQGNVHRFCAIPVQHWAWIFGFLGALFTFIGMGMVLAVIRGDTRLN